MAERLIWARVQKGDRDKCEYSQQDIATMAGVSQSTIGNLESGSRSMPRKLTSIARALGVDSDWLAEGKGDPFTGASASDLPIPDHYIDANELSRLFALYAASTSEGRDIIFDAANNAPKVAVTRRRIGNN